MTQLYTYFFIASFLLCSCLGQAGNSEFAIAPVPADSTLIWLKQYADKAQAYARDKGMNDQFCFLVDLGRASADNRFIVYNFGKDSIEAAGKVTHGRCNEYWLTGRRYDNEPGCGCSSLGKYSVGRSYTGKFGLAYKLYGLDSTNNNAYKRFIVLHAHDCVPDAETEISELCQSDGCPTVSPQFLQLLKRRMSSTNKPILLWMYDSTLQQ